MNHLGNEVDGLTQVFTMLSKRVVGARQKNRRFFLKEATMLRGSSQYTLRYHLTAMHREIVIREKHSRIIVFPLGFREAFPLCCLSVYGFIQSNTMKLGGLGKDTCFFDEMQYPYEDTEQPYFFMADDNGGIQEWFP